MKSPNTFVHRVLGKSVFGAAMLACALWGAVGASTDAAIPAPSHAATELPAHWQGQPVRPLAMSAVEQRFAQRFPGTIARLTDGRQIVVLRDVAVPTRMLHPAADCYRAIGYRIEGERLERTAEHADAPVQRCFTARKGDVQLRVCEQIEDAHGQRFAQRFPGTIARLTDGRQIVVLRDVAVPTRMLHPAADCYRAIGYRIEGERLERTAEHADAPVQRCFTARKGDVQLRVCEQIEDAHGQRFADTSAWYWAAALGRSQGPWRAVTVTRALSAGST